MLTYKDWTSEGLDSDNYASVWEGEDIVGTLARVGFDANGRMCAPSLARTRHFVFSHRDGWNVVSTWDAKTALARGWKRAREV